MPPVLAPRPLVSDALSDSEGQLNKEPPLCISDSDNHDSVSVLRDSLCPSTSNSNDQASTSSLSLHAISHSDKIAATGTLPDLEDNYCKYATVCINGLAGIALMDSGNTWRTVISEHFAMILGLNLELDLRPLKHKKIGTAKANETLEIVGETKQFMHLAFLHCPTKFKFRPVVIKGLAMPINISGPFMKTHHIDQLHSQNALRVQGHLIPLFHDVPNPRDIEQTKLDLVLENETPIPPFSCNHVVAKIKGKLATQDITQPGIVTGSLLFMNNTDLHPWVNALATPLEDGTIRVGILNTTNKTVVIKPQTRYGSLQLACDIKQQDRYPWRIGMIQPNADSRSPVTDEPTTKVNAKKRLAFLLKEFKLSSNPLLDSVEKQTRAAELLLKYFHTFSFNGEFGTTNLIEHTIYTEPGPPINQRYRPINPSLEPQLRQQLDNWLKHDVIEESNSPYNFGLVAVPKKNGTTRWCVDYRALNRVSKRDTFPIGNIEDNLVRLSRSEIFSGIDGSGAFHVIPLEENSREKTAFATPFGSFQFKKLPFGLANGPATYSRLVKKVLHGIPTSIALPYLDDTIVHSPDLESHFVALDRVLHAHKKAGLKLQPAKCQLFQAQIDYLGHTVSKEGIAPMKAYIEVVKNWPLPTTRGHVRAFLGKVGYYRRFIKDFAAIAKPLTDKLILDGTTDKQSFTPTEEFKSAFETLRDQLVSAPILAYPRFDSTQPFIVDTDWSQENSAIGGVLSQKQNGLERVIAYGGHKLNHAQAHYGPPKGELYAVLYFLERWKYYLLHRPFLLRTDHISLKYLESMTAPTGMIQRWLHTLAQYQFTIIHRAGKKHGNADGLSRAPHLKNEIREDNDPILADEVIGALAVQAQPTWTSSYIREAQRLDPILRDLFSLLNDPKADDRNTKNLDPETRLYFQLRSQIEIDEQGILRIRAPKTLFSKSRSVILLPRRLQIDAIRKAHVQMAHKGVQATLDKLKLHAYFRNMKERVAQVLQHCGPCQTKTTRLPDQKHTLFSHQPGFPFQVLSLDFVGPLPPSGAQRYRYLLTIKDTFTRWLEAFPLREATAVKVADTLQNEIFCRFGKCERLHSDQGSQFTSSTMLELSTILNIKLTTTPAYNPKSNPVERSHRDLKACLLALTQNAPQEWVKYIPAILYAMRTSICQATGFSPFQLMFGRHPIEDLDTILPSPTHSQNLQTATQYLRDSQDRLHQAFHLARNQMGLAVARQRRQYTRKPQEFRKDQKVWLFTPILPGRQLPKFKTGWSGPWTIVKEINPLVYEISLVKDTTNKQTVTIDRLREYYDDIIEAEIEPPPGNLQLFGDEFAEFIPSSSGISPAPTGPAGPPPVPLRTPAGPPPPPVVNPAPPGPSGPVPGSSTGPAPSKPPESAPNRSPGPRPQLPHENPIDQDDDYEFDDDPLPQVRKPTISTSSSSSSSSSAALPDFYNLNPGLRRDSTFSHASSHSDDIFGETPKSPSPPPPRSSFQTTYERYAPDADVRSARRQRYEQRTGQARATTPEGMRKELSKE